MGTLDGKVAIITGASSGIGYVAAKLFAQEGAKVVVTARRRAELDGLVAEISDAGGHTLGFPGMAAYAASKAGLVGLTRVLAAEFGAKAIRANAILAGGTDTPMGRTVANTPEARSFIQSLHALRRIAAPEEIARSALYLASDASSFITGTAFAVDGGVSICRT